MPYTTRHARARQDSQSETWRTGVTRHIVEGVWSGYTSAQSRVVHRTIVRDPKPFEKLTAISYTDGTALYLSCRPALPRERVVEIHGYDSLISKCIRHGVSSVAELPR
jgi:hypothetical protein